METFAAVAQDRTQVEIFTRRNSTFFRALAFFALGFFGFVESLQATAADPKIDKIESVLARHPGFSRSDFDVLPGIRLKLEGSAPGKLRDYVVRAGETLSQIAQREMGNPVFVPNGSLDRLLILNPGLRHAEGVVCRSAHSRTTNTLFARSGKDAPPILAFLPVGTDAYDYSVQRGDTLRKIANYWFTSRDFAAEDGVRLVREWNPSLAADREPEFETRLRLRVVASTERDVVVCKKAPSAPVASVTESKKEFQSEPKVAVRVPAAKETPIVSESAVTAASAPANSPAATSAPAPSPSPAEAEFAKLGVVLRTSNWSTKARDIGTGGHAVANSNLNVGIEPRISGTSDSGITTAFYANLTRNTVIQPANRRFTHNAFTTFGIGVDVAIPASTRGQWTLGVERSQHFFIESISTSTLSLTKVPVIKFSGGYRYLVHTAHRLNGSLVGGAAALLPTSADTFDVKAGWSARAGYETVWRLRRYDLLGALFYERRKQNTTLVNQSSQEVWLGLGIRWRLTDGE